MQETSLAPARPRPSLTVTDAVALVVGMVVGVGIFRTPSLVAANASSEIAFLALWLAGGAVSLIGALCYAELASSYPDAGGEYHFLDRAFGPATGFLFAWARMAVIQTGAIAAVAFVLGDHAAGIAPMGPFGPAIYAALAVVVLTGLNISGVRNSMRAQNLLTLAVAALLVAVSVAALMVGPAAPAAVAPAPGGTVTVAGLAMIFILLSYGGWNEAAYLSAELGDPRRNMIRVLLVGIGTITALYLLFNGALLNVLGLEAMRGSKAVAVDLMAVLLGDWGALAFGLVVIIAALSTLNATIFTGARTNYALGRDFPALGYLGRWNGRTMTPVGALLVQGAIALTLVFLGAVTRGGFTTMVEFTAPVFWGFMFLIGLSLMVLRRRHGVPEGGFRVPFYPLTPIAFCATSLFMLYSSLAYTGIGAVAGVGVLMAGVPMLIWARPSRVTPAP